MYFQSVLGENSLLHRPNSLRKRAYTLLDMLGQVLQINQLRRSLPLLSLPLGKAERSGCPQAGKHMPTGNQSTPGPTRRCLYHFHETVVLVVPGVCQQISQDFKKVFCIPRQTFSIDQKRLKNRSRFQLCITVLISFEDKKIFSPSSNQ